LRRAGFDVADFERVPTLQAVGAGLTLWPNASKALGQLDLGTALAAISVPNRDSEIRTWDGRRLSLIPTRDLVARFGAPLIAVHRADLQGILLDALGAEQLHLGARCVGIHDDGAGVTAHFADGRAVRGGALIGADGLHSVVRAHLCGDQPPRYAGYTAWRGVTAFPAERVVPGETQGAGQRFGIVRLDSGRVYWFATANLPEGSDDPPGERRATLLARFAGWHAPITEVIAATDEAAILRNDIYDRDPLPRWGRGRVTLLGDAAHPMTPNLGQGACQALEDAVVLAKCLRATSDLAAGLRAYESQRRLHANRVVRLSRLFGVISQWQHPVGSALRSALYRRTPLALQLRQLAPIVGHEV
jgi:2-polyprenyl-6-methoxyphenol hydroxylase-like FAD-dependent oxidoreductase